jgi:hypothetical protein
VQNALESLWVSLTCWLGFFSALEPSKDMKVRCLFGPQNALAPDIALA